MPPPEKLKHKLVTPDMDGDTDRGNFYMPLPSFFKWWGIKIIQKTDEDIACFQLNVKAPNTTAANILIFFSKELIQVKSLFFF